MPGGGLVKRLIKGLFRRGARKAPMVAVRPVYTVTKGQAGKALKRGGWIARLMKRVAPKAKDTVKHPNVTDHAFTSAEAAIKQAAKGTFRAGVKYQLGRAAVQMLITTPGGIASMIAGALYVFETIKADWKEQLRKEIQLEREKVETLQQLAAHNAEKRRLEKQYEDSIEELRTEIHKGITSPAFMRWLKRSTADGVAAKKAWAQLRGEDPALADAIYESAVFEVLEAEPGPMTENKKREVRRRCYGRALTWSTSADLARGIYKQLLQRRADDEGLERLLHPDD